MDSSFSILGGGRGINMWKLYFLFFKCFSFIFERQRESASKGGAEREGTWNQKQVPGSELSPQSPIRGSNSGPMRS